MWRLLSHIVFHSRTLKSNKYHYICSTALTFLNELSLCLVHAFQLFPFFEQSHNDFPWHFLVFEVMMIEIYREKLWNICLCGCYPGMLHVYMWTRLWTFSRRQNIHIQTCRLPRNVLNSRTNTKRHVRSGIGSFSIQTMLLPYVEINVVLRILHVLVLFYILYLNPVLDIAKGELNTSTSSIPWKTYYDSTNFLQFS